MKKTTLILSTKIILFTCFYISCQKKQDNNTPNSAYLKPMGYYGPVDSFNINYLTNPISISNYDVPFLIFSSRTSFDYTLEELKIKNEVFVLPTSLEDSLPEDPFLEKFESKFSGFTSLRMKINQEIDSLCDANIFDPQTFDPDDHFLEDDYYRTVLNKILEVQINEVIYKVMSTDWVCQFSAGDPNLISFVRSYDVNNLTNSGYDTMINNVLFIYTGSQYVPEEEYGSPAKRGTCDAGIDWQEANGGLINFIGWPQSSICSYSWDWGDGSSNGSGSTPEHTYTKNGKYLVTLTCVCGANTCTESKEVIVTTASTSNACSNPPNADFTIQFPDIGEIILTATVQNNNYSYFWENTSINEIYSGKGYYTYNRSYASVKTYQFCLSVFDGNGCKSNVKCSTITIDEPCCQKGYSRQMSFDNFLPDKKFKYKLIRWNGGPLGRSIAAKTIYFEKRFRKFSLRKNPNKHWRRTKAQIYAKFEGDIWISTRRQYKYPGGIFGGPCPNKFYVNEEKYHGNRVSAFAKENPQSPDNDARLIFTKKDRLTSSHWILLNGVYYGKNLKMTNCN